MGIPDLLLPDVVHVLVYLQSGRLSAGVDRCAGGLDRRRDRLHDARRTAARPAGGRHRGRRGRRDRLPAQHHDPLPVHLVHGGFGLLGPRGLHHGPRDAPHRPSRQIVHSAHHGLRLQRPGDHGLPDDRESQQSADHHTDYPFYVMQRANSDLPASGRHLLRRKRRTGDDRTLCAGRRAGCLHGAADAAVHVPGGRNAVRHGAAALPPADVENHAQAYVGQVRAISAQDGRHDSGRVGGRMVPELLPPHRRRKYARTLRKLLPRTSRTHLRAGVQSAGAELESGRGPVVGRPGQGDHRQYARRTLFRRGSCGGEYGGAAFRDDRNSCRIG